MRLAPLLVIACLLGAFWLAWPTCIYTKDVARSAACLSNAHAQALALGQYATDHDGRYPLRDAWMDATRRYGSPPEWCPALPKGSAGLAFNARLSGAREPVRPEDVPMVYDSLNPIRNASDRVASLPPKGRHAGKNSVAYADGHARREAP